MSRYTDQEYLQTDQYKDSSNLDARIQLHRRFSTNKYGWARWVFDQFNLSSECDVLDVGCGPGYQWRENIDRVPKGGDIVLADLSIGMLRKARQHLGENQHLFRFRVVDAQAIPFADESFDVVVANHMLYHVPDVSKALAEIRRVLKPGGRFYASTVGKAHLQENYELVRRFAPEAALGDARPTLAFLLENGSDQISQWFSDVTLRRYEDALVVTEPELLIAYILSTAIAKDVLVGGKREAFARFVEQELASRGSIYITKDSGMFEALK
jgi:ubiquinone/menaquinone biosynthesis C-methylase UbiE